MNEESGAEDIICDSERVVKESMTRRNYRASRAEGRKWRFQVRSNIAQCGLTQKTKEKGGTRREQSRLLG